MGINEKTIRTLEKKQDTGEIKCDQRGGRPQAAKLKDQIIRQIIMSKLIGLKKWSRITVERLVVGSTFMEI